MQRYRFKDTVTIARKGKHLSMPIDIDMGEDVRKLCRTIRNLYDTLEAYEDGETWDVMAAIFDVIEAFFGKGRALIAIMKLAGDHKGVVECLCIGPIQTIMPKIAKLYQALYKKPLQIFEGVLQ